MVPNLQPSFFLETAPSFIIHCHGYNNQLETLARGSWGQQSPSVTSGNVFYRKNKRGG
jgi:hypothetical protein